MSERHWWHWGVSNASPNALIVWLEPWADEIEVPSRSTATLRVKNDDPRRNWLNVEDTSDHIVVWASGGDCIEVHVDQRIENTASATISVPDAFGISTKRLLNIMFERQPKARLAGRRPTVSALSIWKRMRSAFGL